jgi:hypothetical protein
MATLIDFRKVREDSLGVEYIFGYPEGTSRHLVIEKDSQRGTPSDGMVDGQYERVLAKITRFYRSQALWPDRGSYTA